MEHETQHCFLAWFAESRNIGALEIAEELDDAEAAPGWSWREILSTKRSSCIHAVYLKSCGRSKATILLWISNKCQGWHVSHIQISSLRSSQTCCWYLNLSLPAFCHAANWFCSPDILRCLCAVASCQYHKWAMCMKDLSPFTGLWHWCMNKAQILLCQLLILFLELLIP